MKKKRLLIYLISCFMLGAFVSFLMYQGLWYKLITGLKMIPFYGYFLIVISVFYLTLTAHELGHLFAFVFQGIKIRALYLTIFVFYKKKKYPRFRVNLKMWKMLGGMVVPDLPTIETKESYQVVIKKFAKALMAGPISTIIFASIYILLFLGIWIFTHSYLWIGLLFVSLIFVILFSLVYIKASKLHTDIFYGDFVAYDKIKKDVIFQVVQIEQYIMFSSIDKKSTYQFFDAEKSYLILNTPVKYQLFYLTMIQTYIMYQYQEKQSINIDIYNQFKKLNIHLILSNKEGLQTALELAKYFYYAKDPAYAYGIIEKVLQKSYEDQTSKYLIEQAQYMMYLNDEVLLDMPKDETMQLFEGIIELEEETIERLPFVIYECVFYTEIKW